MMRTRKRKSLTATPHFWRNLLERDKIGKEEMEMDRLPRLGQVPRGWVTILWFMEALVMVLVL